MKNFEACKLLVNELIDINVRQREIVRQISRYAAEEGSDENLLLELENYLKKVGEEADAVRSLYIAVENLFADDILDQIKQK